MTRPDQHYINGITADARKVSATEFLDVVGPLFGMPVRRSAEEQAERVRLCREHQEAVKATWDLPLEEGIAVRAELTAAFNELVAAGKTEYMLLPAGELGLTERRSDPFLPKEWAA